MVGYKLHKCNTCMDLLHIAVACISVLAMLHGEGQPCSPFHSLYGMLYASRIAFFDDLVAVYIVSSALK